MKFSTLVFLLSTISFFNTYSIDEKTANMAALATGITFAVATAGVAAYHYFKEDENVDTKKSFKEKLQSIGIAVLSVATVGSASGLITRLFLSGFISDSLPPIDPEQQAINNTRTIIEYVNKYPFITQAVNQQQLIQEIRRYYVTEDLWLSKAHTELSRLLVNARALIIDINKLRANQNANPQLVADGNLLLPQVQQVVDRLVLALTEINNHPQYAQQRGKDYQEKRNRMNQSMQHQNHRTRIDMANRAMHLGRNFFVSTTI